MKTMAPFAQGRFKHLPQTPTRSHAYFQTDGRDVLVDSHPFGKVRVHYREYGTGPTLLLVHGLMTTSYSFRYVIEGLGTHFRLVIPDLVGCGRSDKPNRCYSADAVSRFLAELVHALGIGGCYALGNSMGGYLCMRAALRDPKLFRRLLNVHSPGLPDRRIRALTAAMALPYAETLLSAIVRISPERWVHKNVHYRDESLKSREETRIYGEPLQTSDGARAFSRYLSETLDADAMQDFESMLEQRSRLGREFPIPMLLLCATEDPMVPPAIGERLKALIPDAELKWLSDSSHFAHVDSPDRFLPIALEYFGVPMA